MKACQRPQVSCCLITIIIRQRKLCFGVKGETNKHKLYKFLKYGFMHFLHNKPNVTQSQFFSGSQLVSNSEFSFPILVALPRLKKPVYPTIYPHLKNRWI